MNINEKGINRFALGISIGAHILFFIIPSCSTDVKLQKLNSEYKIPVQLSVVKPTPPPKPKPIQPKKKVEKMQSKQGIATKKPVPKKPDPEPEKPHPGDRESSEVSSFSEPVTPKIAINNEWFGTIIINATIGPEGKLLNHTLVQSTGHIELDDAFIRTLKTSYTFKPKRIFGKNTASTITIKHTFEP